jgi:hypothetical protein
MVRDGLGTEIDQRCSIKPVKSQYFLIKKYLERHWQYEARRRK